MADYRSGLVAVVGKPNVGKSTLVNTLVGQKVSIVSDKAQTTRRRILGIATRSEYQIVFADTPGLHQARHKLGHALNQTVRQSLPDIDTLLVVVDVSRHPGKEDTDLASLVAPVVASQRTVLCLNKMDRLKPEDVEGNFEAYRALFPTEHVMMTSFTKFQNVDKLMALLVEGLPEGPPLYPEDMCTDQSERSRAAEAVREKALAATRQEVPHALATYVESWEDTPGLLSLTVVILVETEGQKAILVGKGGAMAKKLGTQARLEIEKMVGKKVYLELFVKVREGWRQSNQWLRELEIA